MLTFAVSVATRLDGRLQRDGFTNESVHPTQAHFAGMESIGERVEVGSNGAGFGIEPYSVGLGKEKCVTEGDLNLRQWLKTNEYE